MLLVLEHSATIHLITLYAFHAFSMILILQVLAVYAFIVAPMSIVVRLLVEDLIRTAHVTLRGALVNLLMDWLLLQ